jgi:hypothetical protein
MTSLADGSEYLRVGDPQRVLIGRSIQLTLLVAILFVGFAVAVKDIRALSAVAPWSEDPYDAFFSFAPFFVGLLAALSVVRLLLCRRVEPLPVARVIDLIRSCQVILGSVLVSLGAGWVSVGFSASGSSSATRVFLVVGLAIETTTAVVAATVLWTTTTELASIGPRPTGGADWLTDAMILGERLSSRLGPGREVVRRGLHLIDRTLVVGVRRSPFVAALVASLAFGTFVGLGAILEQDPAILVVLLVSIGTGGMLAFLVTAGSYIGLVRGSSPGVRLPRPLAHATLAAAASLPVAVAFRDSLWWIIGTATVNARLDQLAELLAAVAVATFLVVLIGEMIVRRRRPPTNVRR